MADIHSTIHNSTEKITSNMLAVDCGKPQQEPAPDLIRGPVSTRPMEAALPGSCAAPDASAVTITSTRLLRLPELLARLGVCRATIYLHMAAGKFPKAVALGPRAVGWLEHEIDAWLATKMEARNIIKK